MLTLTALMHIIHKWMIILPTNTVYLKKVYGMCYIIVAIYGLFHPQTHISEVNTVETVLNEAGVEYIGQQRLAPLIC